MTSLKDLLRDRVHFGFNEDKEMEAVKGKITLNKSVAISLCLFRFV